MYKLQKRKIILIGIITILFVSISVIINSSWSKGETEVPSSKSPEIQVENEKNLKEVEEIQSLLYQENGFFEQVSNRLAEKGYEFQMMLAVYSKDDIKVKYILTNKEVTDSVQEEVKSIFFEIVEKNELDSNSFNFKVVDIGDGTDW